MTEHVTDNYNKCALGSDVVLLGKILLMSGVTVTPAARTQDRAETSQRHENLVVLIYYESTLYIEVNTFPVS